MMIKRFLQILIVMILFLMVPNYLYAYDFELGGIYYNLSGSSVIVTSGDIKYQGDVSIPDQVLYKGETYKVISIGSFAFSNCSGLTSVKIPNSINSIGFYAFSDNKDLISITIPSSVTIIGEGAFSSCRGLTSLTLPNSITIIKDNAFCYCIGLTSITIPNSVTSIGKSIFRGCTSLISISVEKGNTNYDSRDYCNAIIESFSNTLVVGCKNTIIPNSVTSIANEAFSVCSGLTSVTIPNSVSSIGRAAFEESGLISVKIPASVRYIGDSAFNMYSLLSVISEIRDPFPIDSRVFSSNTYNKGQLIVPEGESSAYKSTDGWNKFVNMVEDKPDINYTFSITASGNGSATYDGTTARNETKTFTLNEGANATVIFSPDNGYRVKSVKVNNTDVTSSVSNNSYAISNINSNTTVEVEFEAIPVTTYELSVRATGNGSATYDGVTIRDNSRSFTVDEGEYATITFVPDEGYRIKSLMVNSSDVTSQISNNSFTIDGISANTTVEVEFEAIPVTTYTLSVLARGNGSATYGGVTIRDNSRSFTVDEGEYATITFVPDEGYRIKSLMVNSSDVTSQISNNSFTIDGISANTTVEVEFEAIPVTTYTLSVLARGNGSATYGGVTIRDDSRSFTVNEGAYATITFIPDEGYRIKSLMVNSSDVTSQISNNSFTIDGISANTTVEVDFEAIPVTTYTLSVLARGNGSATYDGVTIRDDSRYFTVNEGEYATILFSPDEGYQIKNLMVNNFDVTSQILNNSYTISNINANTMIEVEFEAIATRKCTLTLKAMGNGSAWYNGVAVTNSIQTFSIEAGALVIISFLPSDDYNIKSVKVDNVTTQISGNQYIINSISADTTIEVEFESDSNISGYTLTIKALGNGTVWYEKSVRNSEETIIIQPDSSPIIAFLPDTGYRIKSVKNNGEDVTSQVISNRYTISNVSTNITLEVEFEAIPATTYTLTITASGNGYVSYGGITTSNNSKSFTLNEGTSATITFSPDNGYRIKKVMMNSVDVTSSVSNNSYTISNIKTNTTVEVEFEAIPVSSFTLKYVVDGETYKTYQILEGAVITPEAEPTKEGYTFSGWSEIPVTMPAKDVTIVGSFTVNKYKLTYLVDGEEYMSYNIEYGATITPEAEPMKEGYTFSGWSEIPKTMPANDVTITGSFTKNGPDISELGKIYSISGVNYEVVSTDNQSVVVSSGDYGKVLEIQESFIYGDYTWEVVGLKEGALDNCEELAAVIWNPSAVFNARVSNPNLLLYVKDKAYASYGVNNVIVNGTAESIELMDASSGNDFYCPKSFKTRKISYSHRYNMETGLGDSKGWETIVLPFDVQKYTSPKGEIVPFTKWSESDKTRPFWLFELTASGYKDVEGIKANTPYIISMPNNPQYLTDYVIFGLVTFSAENVEVKASDDMLSAKYQDRTFVPNYTNKAGDDYLALNVNSYYVTNPSTDIDGSKFIKGLRAVHPFEAYMTTTSNTRSIDVMDGMTTAIRNIMMTAESKDVIKVYDTKGVFVKTAKADDDLRKGLAAGVYIVNGKKMIIK